MGTDLFSKKTAFAKVETLDKIEEEEVTTISSSKQPPNRNAAPCPSCKLKIMPNDALVFFDRNCWHSNCFACFKCKLKIGGGTKVFTHNEKHYCRKCHVKFYVKNCHRCGKPVIGHSRIFDNKTYHPECLTCFKCHLQFATTGDPIYSRENKNYHKACAIQQFAKMCQKCRKSISPFEEETGVVYKGKHYHNACFVCFECRKLFPDGEAIFSKKVNDDKEQVFCLGCYDERFGRICSLCKKLISAIDLSCSTGGYQWHKPKCLKCRECRSSLVGKKLVVNDDGSTSCSNNCKI